MKKAQLIELIQRNLSGGDSPPEIRGRYHDKEISLYIGMAMESLIDRADTQRKEMYNEQGRNLWSLDVLTKTYQIPVLKDDTRDRYYSELPVEVLSVTNNNGIRMISPIGEESSVILPRSTEDIFLMNNMDVNLLGMPTFTLEGRKIWYTGMCNWSKVLAKLALKFEEMADDDEIDIPDGRELDVFQIVIGLLQQKRPMDIADDSTVIQTTQ